MIRYYRTTPGPHWVQMDALAFGDDVPAEKRRELQPGRCDGQNPAYTEAFDLAGIRAAALLAKALDKSEDATRYESFAAELFTGYDRSYGAKLPDKYGSYCVLWPCRLYPCDEGNAYEQFRGLGPQKPQSWRYFPLARAHQSLLAGNRAAGYRTLEAHFDQPQMQGWYAFDEGGKSGSGGWGHVRTKWNGSVAMPHGWAIAEVHLLLRDCLAYEDGNRLVLVRRRPRGLVHQPRGNDNQKHADALRPSRRLVGSEATGVRRCIWEARRRRRKGFVLVAAGVAPARRVRRRQDRGEAPNAGSSCPQTRSKHTFNLARKEDIQ